MVMILGILFYSYIIGTLTNLLGEFDKRNSDVTKKINTLELIARDFKLHSKFK